MRLYVAIGAIGAGVGTTALRVPTSGVSYESGRVIGCDGLRVPAPGGVVLVMSPGLALRQVGSRESSEDGFRRYNY